MKFLHFSILFIIQKTIKKLGVVMYTYNPSTGRLRHNTREFLKGYVFTAIHNRSLRPMWLHSNTLHQNQNHLYMWAIFICKVIYTSESLLISHGFPSRYTSLLKMNKAAPSFNYVFLSIPVVLYFYLFTTWISEI